MVSNQLRVLRESHNWTQRELGEKLGVSHYIVSDWELGKRCPSRKNEKKLFELFGKSLDCLLEPNDQPA